MWYNLALILVHVLKNMHAHSTVWLHEFGKKEELIELNNKEKPSHDFKSSLTFIS